MLKDSTLRTFMERYENSGLIKSFNKTDMTMTLKGDRTILWRSGDKPDKIRGISAGWAWLDEAAYCDEEVYKVVLGRLRRRPGRLWMTTTPNGKNNWVYRLVQSRNVTVTYASTKTNRYNPDFYVETLLASYDEKHAAQEVEGLFVDLDGTLMQRKWFREWADKVPDKMVLCRSWDAAATEGGGDHTCGLLIGAIPGTDKIIILDRVYGQYGADKVDTMIRTTADTDGPKVTVVLEQEPGSAGKRLLSQQVKALQGHKVHWYASGARKLARAVPVARAAAQGRVYYMKGDWNESFFTEIESFTGTTADDFDDQVDALSLGFTHLEGNVKRIQVL
jgi:predicted phage terminase large subunit-like protein